MSALGEPLPELYLSSLPLRIRHVQPGEEGTGCRDCWAVKLFPVSPAPAWLCVFGLVTIFLVSPQQQVRTAPDDLPALCFLAFPSHSPLSLSVK